MRGLPGGFSLLTCARPLGGRPIRGRSHARRRQGFRAVCRVRRKAHAGPAAEKGSAHQFITFEHPKGRSGSAYGTIVPGAWDTPPSCGARPGTRLEGQPPKEPNMVRLYFTSLALIVLASVALGTL